MHSVTPTGIVWVGWIGALAWILCSCDDVLLHRCVAAVVHLGYEQVSEAVQGLHCTPLGYSYCRPRRQLGRRQSVEGLLEEVLLWWCDMHQLHAAAALCCAE